MFRAFGGRCKQRENQIDRLMVHRVEIDRLFQSGEHADNLVHGLESRVRDRDAAPDPGGAERFSFLQCGENLDGVQSVNRIRLLGYILQQTFLAGYAGRIADGFLVEDFFEFHCVSLAFL